jgi:hypothetical protein
MTRKELQKHEKRVEEANKLAADQQRMVAQDPDTEKVSSQIKSVSIRRELRK